MVRVRDWRLGFGVLCLICICLWGTVRVESKIQSRPQPVSVLSDTSGEIEEILLQYSALLSEEVLPTYRDLFSKMDPETTIHVACENGMQAYMLNETIDGWNVPSRERIVVTSIDEEISIWTRDRFIIKTPLFNPCLAYVLLPRVREECAQDWHNDKKVPVIHGLIHGKRLRVQQSPLFFEGGNIVTNDDRLFTGHSTLTMQEIESENEIIRLLEKDFGKEVFVVGSSNAPEPLWHIDMYLTPISDSLVLLAEPILDRGILDHAFSEESSHETGETKEAEPSPEDDSVTDFVRPGRPSYSH